MGQLLKELIDIPALAFKPVIDRASNKPYHTNKRWNKTSRKKLKSYKAAGPDNSRPVTLKASRDLTAKLLHKLNGDILVRQIVKISQKWNERHQIKLPKQGNLKKDMKKNDRGIALLSVEAKVLNVILLTWLFEAIDEKLGEHQAGCRKDRSSIDQIVALRMIIKQSLEWKTSLMINYIDFEKAFDSLDREPLWNIMQ